MEREYSRRTVDHGLKCCRFTFYYIEAVVVESGPQGAGILVEVPLLVLCLTHVILGLWQHHFCIFFKTAVFNRQYQSVLTTIYVQILSGSWVTKTTDKAWVQMIITIIVVIKFIGQIRPFSPNAILHDKIPI